MSAREEVLARLRGALATAPPPEPVARRYRLAGEHRPGSPALLDLLVDRLEDYRAEVHRTDEQGVPSAVAEALAAGTGDEPAGRVRVVVPAGLPPAWLAAADVETLADDNLSPQVLDDVDAVVTGAAVAVAETGTLVLDGSAGQGRRAVSLVPDLHVCVVLAGQVVQTVPEAVGLLDPRRPLTWISGPSATSDIELVRVEGVHGPRRLHVVLVA
ncbi:MAG TPA: LUD domain-containing protein [Mycobacteriales bacterium]|nr:LUD domain-containing protein [Mycobacteriales bacterium]